MSSIHGKPGAPTSILPSNEPARGAVVAQLAAHLADRDEAGLNLFLFQVGNRARAEPGQFHQVFNHLHQLLSDGARQGIPVPHKEEISKFLADHGLERLRSLTQDILKGSRPDELQRDIATARALLAAGYGGKETKQLAAKIDLRSFGQSAATHDAHDATPATGQKKGTKATLRDALSVARKGVATAGQGVAAKLTGVRGRRGSSSSGGDKP